MPGIYAAFGLEFIVARDIALTILPRYTLFIPVSYTHLTLPTSDLV